MREGDIVDIFHKENVCIHIHKYMILKYLYVYFTILFENVVLLFLDIEFK